MRRWQCEICNAKFKQGSTLKHHVLAKHQKVKPWMCQHCNMTFTQKSNLTTHIRTIHENHAKRPFPCQMCNASFMESSRLSLHISNVHSKKVGEIINDDDIEEDIEPAEIQNALKPIVVLKVQGTGRGNFSKIPELRGQSGDKVHDNLNLVTQKMDH